MVEIMGGRIFEEKWGTTEYVILAGTGLALGMIVGYVSTSQHSIFDKKFTFGWW